MDDHDYDGLGRSSSFEEECSADGIAAEAYVPSKIGNGALSASASLASNIINLKKDHAGARARKQKTAQELTPLVGSSPAAASLRELIAMFAEDDSPVLISGESGVGKELVARHLHEHSRRRDKPFSPLNAGAIPETLAAAELFGHARGAFTGAVGEREGAIALANGGVLFLDEIGEMPLSVQTHLLRVLEDGMITKVGGKTPVRADFRLISATNVSLHDHVNNNKFRRDLYYRVNVLAIDVPPLRDRGDDVVEIAEAMIAGHENERYRKSKLTPKAADRLRSHAFPGNVRELRNVLARALVYAQGEKILPEHLFFDRQGCLKFDENSAFDIDEAKTLVGRFIMMKALYACEGNVTKAAALTRRSRGTLHALKKSLEGEDFASAYRQICAEMKSLLNGC